MPNVEALDELCVSSSPVLINSEVEKMTLESSGESLEIISEDILDNDVPCANVENVGNNNDKLLSETETPETLAENTDANLNLNKVVSKVTPEEELATDVEIIDNDDGSDSGSTTCKKKDNLFSSLDKLEKDLKMMTENVLDLSDNEMSQKSCIKKISKISLDCSKGNDNSMVYSISDDDSDEVMAIDDNSLTLSKCKKISPKRKSSENNVSSKKRRNEADLSDDFVVDILDDDEEEEDVSFVTKQASTSQRCGACSQYLDNVCKVHPRSPNVEYIEETSIVKDSRVAVQGLDVDEEQQFRLYDFSIYDDQGHLVPLDSELIEKGKKVKFCGKVKGAFSENKNDASSDDTEFEGLNVYDVGPIEGWWITGLYPGESVNIGISSSRAYYYLRDTSEVYASMMSVLNEKVKILKCVYELIEDVKLNEDLNSFSYEDLLERLIAEKPDLDATHLLLQHGGFVVQQILSFEEAADDDTGIDLLSTPLIKTLCAFSGFEPPKSRKRQFQPRRMPAQERRPTMMPMTKATTTPLVRQFFEHLFKDQLAKGDKFTSNLNVSKSGRCGVCVPCLRQDCGQCTACRSKIDFGGKGNNAFKQTCFKKQCEQQNVFYIDDDDDDEPSRLQRIKNPAKKSPKSVVKWIDEPIGFSSDKKEKFYDSVEINKNRIQTGDFVLVRSDDPLTPAYVCKILYLFESNHGPVGHVAHYCRGGHTVLGEVADPKEIFAIMDCEDIQLMEVLKKVNVTYWPGPSNWHDVGGKPESMWTPSSKKNDDEGYWFRLQYDTETARFEDISPVLLNPTTPSSGFKNCQICLQVSNEGNKNIPKKLKNGFILNDKKYQVGDAVFLEPDTFLMENNLKKGFRTPKMKKVDREKYPEHYRKFLQNGKESIKGNYARISDPFQVAIILRVTSSGNGDVNLCLRKLYRPENTVMSLLEVSRTDLNLLFWTNGVVKNVPASKVTGRCIVSPKTEIAHPEPVIWAQSGNYRFYYEKEYDVRSQEFSELGQESSNYRPPAESLKSSKHPKIDEPLKTLDVFAGCGGLSAGLESSGVAQTKWAIEVYPAAAEAFALNHSEAKVINLDCNEVLRVAMDGHEDAIRRRGIPRKGEVDLMCGGPPCQGFSTMNAFTEREYSQFKNSCIVSYLSFCDFYRPKFFILENVRNFLVFKKAVMLKLCISALVRMGYQVTFGVLQAGNFGVPQTRLRAFLIAAAPGEKLPKFPEPETVFEKFSLRTLVDEKGFESSCRWTSSAPYRNVTTGDAISDLPEIESGESRPKMRYGKSPESHFQKLVRWSDRNQETLEVVEDHVCKRVPPLTQARISLIPQKPGADWRDLPNVRVRLEDGMVTDKLRYRYANQGVCRCMSGRGSRCDPADRQHNTIIPWAMVHTGKRNNQWLGCYGRVSNDSYFSTTITLPHPERKQGRVLHPTQNRIVSVRECARSQGFHDSFKFFGTILEKHRQIGNAVPPPVGRALGLELRKSLAQKKSLQTDLNLGTMDCDETALEESDVDEPVADSDPLPNEEDNDVVDLDDEDGRDHQVLERDGPASDQEEITLD